MEDLQQRIEDYFHNNSRLQVLCEKVATSDQRVWLVGGFLRDLLLDRSVSDIDLAVSGDPTGLARSWAKEVDGRWFWLDAERKQSRVLLPEQLTVDFAPLRGPDIFDDLLARDFTINAMAYPLSQGSDARLEDPCGGAVHLQHRELHCCHRASFDEDPLRLFKGIRHALALDFYLSPECFSLMQLKPTLLRNVAGERIRDELGKILSSERAVDGLRLMIRTGILENLLGPPRSSWNESRALDALFRLQEQIKDLQQKLEHDTEEEQGKNDPFPQKALFLLAKLVSLYTPQNLPDLLHRRLRLSRHQQKLIQALQVHPGAAWLEKASQVQDSRQQALLVEQLGFSATEQLIYLSLTEDELVFQRAILLAHAFRTHQVCGKVPDLIRGDQLEYLLRGRPKHEIGIWQSHLKAAEIAGEINSTREATTWLNQQLSI